jgi:serine/threonine-protein kinase
MMSGDRPQENAPDRNVLFGITAWQLGLVDRDALMAAMYEWMTDRSRPLPDVLEAAGKLRPEDRRRVEQMVEWQTDSRSGNAARTLAELESVAEVSGRLREIAAEAEKTGRGENAGGGGQPTPAAKVDSKAPTLAPRVETLAGEHQSDVVPADDGSQAGSSASAPGSPAPDDRFEVVRSHARGGLGEVYLAKDRQLKREVALKLILPKQSKNDTSRIRFLREAEITGALEHPGIVPVYGLGTRPDGRPYYAMRFIRGESLDDAIGKFHDGRPDRTEGQRALELRNLLTRFVALCNTIEYAHSQGILHRDIKPENVMLGPYGETLVVDWGLARPLAAAAEFDSVEVETGGTTDESISSAKTIQRPTQMGTVVGTPQFMSPEQATGRLDLMSPASDIYSLGATLYYLLTNQPAFTSLKVREVLADVAKGRFLKPRLVDKSIPLPLEAICLKAMALDPAARYSSAQALADDLEHWMADEPVSALPETEMERAARWMRHHKTWTQAMAAAMILVALTAGVAYVREATLHQTVQTALEDEKEARIAADDARTEADKNRVTAEEQRKLAQASAARADAQSRLTMETLKRVVIDVQAKLKNVPAVRTARLEMLNNAVASLNQVAENLESATEADRSLLHAHLDIGDVLVVAGVAEGKGRTEEARKQFELAADVAKKLHADAPGSPLAAADLAEVYQRLGDIEIQTGNRSLGAEAHHRSLELRKRVLEVEHNNTEIRRKLSVSYERMGDLALADDDLAAAENYFKQSLDVRKQLSAAAPKNPEARRDLSVTLDRLGDVALRRKDSKSAEGYYRQSLDIRSALAAEDKTGVEARRDVAISLFLLGDVAFQRGDLAAAEVAYRDSHDLRTMLAAEDASSFQALRDLAVSFARLGEIAERRNDAANAEKFFDRYHELMVKLAEDDPTDSRLQLELANSYQRRGHSRLQKEETSAAIDAYEKQFAILRNLAANKLLNARLTAELVTLCESLIVYRMQRGELVAAERYLDEYVTLTRLRSEEFPQDGSLLESYINALVRSSDLLIDLGRFELAQERNDQVIFAIEHTKVPDLQTPVARSGLMANACEQLGKILLNNRDAKGASEWFERAVKQMREFEKVAGNDGAPVEWFDEQSRIVKYCAQISPFQTASTSTTGNEAVPTQFLDFRAAFLVSDDKLLEAEQTADLQAARAVEDLRTAARTVMLAGGPAWRRSATTGETMATGGMGFFVAGRRWSAIAAATEADEKARLRRKTRAVELLTQAADAGYFRNPVAAAQLRKADDFQGLQERDDFRKLVDRVKRELPGDAAKIMGE